MKYRSLYITALALILSVFAISLSAQDSSPLDRLNKNITSSCVELSYTYSVRKSGVNMTGNGDLTAQGLFWKLVGNGMELFCDSESVWVVDPSLKEVVIEPARNSVEDGHSVNPAILLMHMKEMFVVHEMRPLKDGLVLYILKPVGKSDMDYLNVELNKSDASISSATMAFADGNLINIKVSSMKLTPLRSAEEFRPQTVYDSTWIVTDLR